MSRFDAEWLALRETVDERSRSQNLVARIRGRYPAIIDLGAGTGANLRWLAPKLGFGQKWTLIDNDPALLATADVSIRAWAEAFGGAATEASGKLVVSGPGFDCQVTTKVLDLSRHLDQLALADGSLVTGSALLDLVSRDWLERLVAGIAASRASVLWALTYSGSAALYPRLAADAAIVAELNRHQLTDKGFGPALGPSAHAVACDLLGQAGLAVFDADSSWRLGSADRHLLRALIDGWVEASTQIAPDQADRFESWRRERSRLAATGAFRLTVGHRDLAARPIA